MSDNKFRLPSIAEMVSSTSSGAYYPSAAHHPSDRWALTSASQPAPAPVDSSGARCTPVAAPPLRPDDGSSVGANPGPPSWRAINATSPQHSVNSTMGCMASASSNSTTASSCSLQLHPSPVNRHSPPRQGPSHTEAATIHDRPITTRQDPTGSKTTSKAAPTSTVLPTPPATAIFSPRLADSQELSRVLNACDAAAYPTTPPSPAPSPESHSASTHDSRLSTAHDIKRTSPPTMSRYDVDHRGRAYSDPQSDLATLSQAASTPHRTKSSRVSTQSNMPPPPSPVSIVSGPASSVSFQTQGSVSKRNPASPNPQESTADGRIAGLGSPFNQAYQRHDSALVGDSQTRCHYCKEIWDYSPPDERSFRADPSTNVDELANTSALLLHSFYERGRLEAESYHDWARQHLIESTDENTIMPCPARERMLRRSPRSNKRKADAFEDRQVPIKYFREHFQELSCDSPPLDQLTPPPDLPSVAAQKQKPLYNFKTESGEIKVNEQLAAILGVPEAPRYYDQPLHDTENMFGRPKSRTSKSRQPRDKSSP